MEAEIITSYVGRLSAEKNVVAMLEALGHVRAPSRATVWVVGDGPLRDLAGSLVENDPLLSNVEFLGQVKDVAAILHRSHFLLLVSQERAYRMPYLKLLLLVWFQFSQLRVALAT